MNPGDSTTRVREADMFDIKAPLRGIYESVIHHKLLVVVTCLLTLLLLTACIVVWPPLYTANALIMAENNSDAARDGFYNSWAVFRKDDSRTEIQLINTGPLLAEVVERENLTYDDVYHPFLSHAAHLWGESLVGKAYRSVKRSILGVDADMPDSEAVELAKIIHDMSAGIKVSPVAEANVGRLRVKGPSRRVASIANAVLDTYMEQRTERYTEEARRAYDYLTVAVEESAVHLADIERRKLMFSQQNKLMFELQKEGLEVTKLIELESTIAADRTLIAEIEATRDEVDDQLQSEPETRTTVTVFEVNTIRESIKQRRSGLQTALSLARNRFQEDSPEILDYERDIQQLDALIADASEQVETAKTEGLNGVRQGLIAKRNQLQSQLEGTRAGLSVMLGTAATMRKRLSEVPALEAELRGLNREYGFALSSYQQLLGKQAQAKVSLATTRVTMPSMRIIEYATIPAKKTWPKPKLLYPAGLVLGLLLGVAAASVRSFVSGRVLSEHVVGGRGDAPLYGTIDMTTQERPLRVVRLPTGTDSPSGGPRGKST